MADQAEHLRQLMFQAEEATSKKNMVIAVASGKGGVGKTNFSVNFALSLQQAGHRPVIIDTDVGFADVEVLLGIHPRHTIVDVIRGTSIWDALEYHETGLPFLSAGSGLLDLHELLPSDMHRLMDQMQQLHNDFDVVLLDCGAGMGRNLGQLLSAVDDLILITTPEPTAIADCYALIKMLVRRGDAPPMHIVVNRVPSLPEGVVTAEKLQMVASRFLDHQVGVLGYVLEDQAVPKSVMRQQALLTAFPSSPAAKCFRTVAKTYRDVVQPKSDSAAVEQDATRESRSGIAGFFERVFRRRNGGDYDSGHSA